MNVSYAVMYIWMFVCTFFLFHSHTDGRPTDIITRTTRSRENRERVKKTYSVLLSWRAVVHTWRWVKTCLPLFIPSTKQAHSPNAGLSEKKRKEERRIIMKKVYKKRLIDKWIELMYEKLRDVVYICMCVLCITFIKCELSFRYSLSQSHTHTHSFCILYNTFLLQ